MSGEQDRDALAVERIIADLALTDEASEISTLLNDHAYVPSGLRGVSRCACGLACHGMPHEWRNHVASVLADLIRRVRASALREVDTDEMAAAWGEGASWFTTGRKVADVVRCWLDDEADRIEGER